MRIIIAVIAIVYFSLQGCAVNKLGKEIERADSTYALIRVTPMDTTQPDTQILMVLYQRTDSGLKMYHYRSPAAGEDSFFLVPVDDYSIIAFEDLNGDRIYQVGEPADSSNEPPLNTDVAERDKEFDFNNAPALSLHLSGQHELPMAIDLSTQSLQSQLENVKRSYLKVTSWDNPAFSEENVKKGLWQPLSFLEDTGFGLYLLQELDPNKQPLLLIHGINGSPVNFRALADKLDDRYQLLLFQYPSGFPLDQTAYTLHRAVSDFVDRFTQKKLHVIAHSMGGLVGRGMLIQNSPETNARIGKYITLATPWSGHDAARMGVKWSPSVAPVWKSMSPNSKYLQGIFTRQLAETIQHHLFFTFSHDRDGPSQGDDGVVTVQSQLYYQAQREARALYGINDNHNGILSNPCAIRSVQVLLEGGKLAQDTPLPSCIPSSP